MPSVLRGFTISRGLLMTRDQATPPSTSTMTRGTQNMYFHTIRISDVIVE